MDEKKKKIIIISGAIMAVILVVILAVTIITKNNKAKEKLKAPLVENIVGKIINIDVEKIEVATKDGSVLILAVPPNGVSFAKQRILEDGSYLNERIALFDIPKDKDVDIQYNSETNELRMIVVK